MVQNVTIISGTTSDGEPIERETTIKSTTFSVKVDGRLYSPAVANSVEIENDGETDTTSDQCGHTSRTRTGDGGWLVRVQGIVTANEDRSGNLSFQMLRDVIAGSDTAKIRSDVIDGEFVVSNTVITQAGDLYSIQTVDTDGEEQAFEFNIQFGESESG